MPIRILMKKKIYLKKAMILRKKKKKKIWIKKILKILQDIEGEFMIEKRTIWK